MARDGNKTTAPGTKDAAVPEPANDRDELDPAELARLVLSRDIRPRVADVRRLAEAVLAMAGRPGKDSKQAKGGKKKKDKAGGKKRKLAKIPRQHSRK